MVRARVGVAAEGQSASKAPGDMSHGRRIVGRNAPVFLCFCAPGRCVVVGAARAESRGGGGCVCGGNVGWEGNVCVVGRWGG